MGGFFYKLIIKQFMNWVRNVKIMLVAEELKIENQVVAQKLRSTCLI